MQIAVCGKTNVGKSTFFSAATRVDAEISNRTFTTIKPNRGVGYVTAPCVCTELGVKCQPVNSKCENGTRLIPVKIIDIAGLVPGAHKGKGLGLEFLRHVERTSIILMLIEMTENSKKDLTMLEEELEGYAEGVIQNKPRIVVGTKLDVANKDKNWLDILGQDAFLISSVTGEGLDKLLDALWQQMKNLKHKQENGSN